MEALKGYPSYRDSGLPWLGAIPEHWDVRRNGRLFAERVETGFEDLPILEVSLRTGVRVRDMEHGARKQQMADRSKYKRAARGDVAYNMMRMWQGAVGVAPVDGLISPAYVVARPFPEVDPRYYTYLFRTSAYMREVNKFSRGIVSDRNRLYWDEFKQMPSAFPPTEEQTRIADFLDDHNRRTTRLIRNKRRLIGLLNEQKQAIINRAVTRGLSPNAPMKRTGIEWIPEVPAHWEVKPLKQICEVLFSNVDKHSHDGEGRVLLCNYTDVYKNDFITSDMGFMAATATPAEIERFHLGIGDVMITKDSESWNDIGVPAIVTETLEGVLCGYHLALLRAERDALLPMFLFRALTASSIAQQFYVEATGVTRYGLSKLAIKNLLLPVPPLREQSELVAAMAAAIEPLSASVGRVNQEISLVREYRERLIADVITGKLDVRHVEIAAPADEPVADEDNALDEDLDLEDTDELAEVED
jgi:type I restriction enzyme S subunit